MTKRIKYIAYYNLPSENVNQGRSTFLAINSKVDYIVDTLIKKGYEVEIISPSWTNNEKGYFKGSFIEVKKGVYLRQFSTFGSNNLFGNIVKKLYSLVSVFLYVLYSLEKKDIIIAYHSLSLMGILSMLRIVKKNKIILEVEEIYSTVWGGKVSPKQEIKFINKFENFLFASDNLKKIVKGKLSVTIYGAYRHIDSKDKIKKEDSIINLVYAGSIDEVKGGAYKAVEVLTLLPSHYKLDILGFGDKKSLEKLNNLITSNFSDDEQRCKYHGALSGKEYENFLLKCDIGLNPQNEGEYMSSAFPSKILVYLSHHLKVVSTRIDSILNSQISPYLTFANDDSPLEIAKAIMNVRFENKQEDVISKLDFDFQNEFEQLLYLD